MDPAAIRAKFGAGYQATELTYRMGIDQRLTAPIAARFRGLCVLETCTGGGFTTIALARATAHVTTVEIDPAHQAQARHNVARAGLSDRVTFLAGDILAHETWDRLPPVDAAFLDPDWAVTGPAHVHHFRRSTTRPPADTLLERVLEATPNVALILPPQLDLQELEGLPAHERQSLYLEGSHELYCLWFGALAQSSK
jgi:tRNA1(Val) A37 N6-methylase TrmN6